MMPMRTGLILTLIFLLQSAHLLGQETRIKRTLDLNVKEEFFVLKDDKKIREGEALKTYHNNYGTTYIISYGSYHNNLKSDLWLTCYANDPVNSLRSSGQYKEGKKEGEWRYYYRIQSDIQTMGELSGSMIRTHIRKRDKSTNKFNINIDSMWQQIESKGKFINDQKAGVWEYYAHDGVLLQKYNHTKCEIIKNIIYDPTYEFCSYIGGFSRFHNLYYYYMQEIDNQYKASQTSEAIFEVQKEGGYKFVESSGDPEYKEYVEQILNNVPHEWTAINGDDSKKLQLIFSVVHTESYMLSNHHSIDRRVVRD